MDLLLVLRLEIEDRTLLLHYYNKRCFFLLRVLRTIVGNDEVSSHPYSINSEIHLRCVLSQDNMNELISLLNPNHQLYNGESSGQ